MALLVSLGVLGLAVFVTSQFLCLSAWLSYGAQLSQCPSGKPRPGAEIAAYNLSRGRWGNVRVAAPFAYTLGPADQARRAYVGRFSHTLDLVVDGEPEPLEPEDGWRDQGFAGKWGKIKLREDLPDGIYPLRLTVDSALGKATHAVDLPVFAPARIHVLTDRPLYEPGQTVRYRAVVLRAFDLTPLDGRVGTMKVLSPSGEMLLEERVRTGAYGVLAGDFPLDDGAEVGRWRLRYESGEDTHEIGFQVEPFTLPRFSVEARSVRSFYQRGQSPVVRGDVRYASGAPVKGALLDISWRTTGSWPPPTGWMQKGAPGSLPVRTVVDGRGAFELKLPRIPQDLLGQVFLIGRIGATDEAKDRVEGSVTVLLSRDAIQAQVESELGSGVAEGYNNRVFVRVTTADGRPLDKTTLRIRRAWEARDPGREAETDEDGVAALQLDPGPPVNVVIPAVPVRPPPAPPAVARTRGHERLRGESLSLADQLVLDRAQPRLEPCGRFLVGEADGFAFSLLVDESGAVTGASGDDSRLGACVQDVFRGLRFGPGRMRLMEVGYRFTAQLPRLQFQKVGPSMPAELLEALGGAALDARSCFRPSEPSASLPRLLFWHLAVDGRPTFSWRSDPAFSGRTALGPSTIRCIEGRLARTSLEPWSLSALRRRKAHGFGAFRMTVDARASSRTPKVRDTVKLGYEFEVIAAAKDEEIGRTKVVVEPAVIPRLRLRAEPTIVTPNDQVEVRLLRGTNFEGELPKKLTVRYAHETDRMDFDAKTRSAVVQIDEKAAGWVAFEAAGVRTMVFVPSRERLAIEIQPDRPRYRPKETARLSIFTSRGGRGHPASVGLFGVDQSLAQLTALPGANAYGGLVTPTPNSGPAFGVLDVQALTSGRVRGANAARALVLRVSQRAPVPERDRVVSTSGGSGFDAVALLTDVFYQLLDEVHTEVRRWEKDAPKEARLDPPTMAGLYGQARARLEASERSAKDAYGRPLALSYLPEDLLALVDPRVVVVDATRLPEDVENWVAWVRKERPE